MVVLLLYLVLYRLQQSSVRWTSQVLQGTRTTRPCLNGTLYRRLPDIVSDEVTDLIRPFRGYSLRHADGGDSAGLGTHNVDRGGSRSFQPILDIQRYSVTQSYANTFLGYVVLDTFNNLSRDENNILDQIYIKNMSYFHNIIRKCKLTLNYH